MLHVHVKDGHQSRRFNYLAQVVFVLAFIRSVQSQDKNNFEVVVKIGLH